jgi:CRP-like cAMP-binding protein
METGCLECPQEAKHSDRVVGERVIAGWYEEQEPIAHLAAIGSRRRYAQATFLSYQDDAAGSVFLVEGGQVALIVGNEDGGQYINGFRGRGALLGLAWVVLNSPPPVSLWAAIECEVRVIPRDSILKLMERDKDAASSLVRALSREVQHQIAENAAYVLWTAAQRFEDFLWRLCQDADSPRVQLPIRKAQLAQWLGVSPVHLSNIIRRLEERSILRREKGGFFVPDPDRLHHRRRIKLV